MPYEIDFLPVGQGERSGDAIALRYFEDNQYRVMVVDGGDKDAGERLVHHVRTAYGTNRVDYVVNTHPDVDHASGLEIVMEELQVGELWLHRPWNHYREMHAWCADRRFTPRGYRERLCEAMRHAYCLEQIATRKRIPIKDPYQGAKIGTRFWVAAPSMDWYLTLVHHFDKAPETRAPELPTLAQLGLRSSGGIVRNAMGGGLLGGGLATVAKPQHDEQTYEWWNYETLEDAPETSPDNESSVVLYGQLDNHILLTGDAGIQALNHAMDWLGRYNINPATDLKFIQVPHHGSRRNVDPATLDRLLGPVVAEGVSRGVVAIASTGAASDHPRRVVTNAFTRRGAQVYTAKGQGLRHHKGMGTRIGWSAAKQVPFYDAVEA